MSMSYTKHAVKRLAERFPETQVEGVHPLVCMNRAFQGATLERGFLNNSKLIVKMLEERGDFDYDYFVKGNIVFVTTKGTVVTVIDRGDNGMQNIFGDKTNNSRFRKKGVATSN